MFCLRYNERELLHVSMQQLPFVVDIMYEALFIFCNRTNLYRYKMIFLERNYIEVVGWTLES
ncbi:hypothetical protein SAMN04487861_11819 [Selenomonas ruminantium]|uniref:Uncharacterized protein n=1 Tax=Selenomonas ruminantium TaxID=971 RepID=A0A1I3FXV0_SELRU|nr:hypothetical protein SAMN04487861_11819 [Selenomonas ruminantium]